MFKSHNIALLLILLAFACTQQAPEDPQPNTPVEGVTLSESSYVLWGAGKVVTLCAAISPTNATNQKLYWTVSDANAISIKQLDNKTCQVTSVKPGKSTVTVVTDDGLHKASCNFDVISVCRNAITEPYDWMSDSESQIKKRLEDYKAMGADVIRLELSWGALEPSQGITRTSIPFFTIAKLCKEAGLKIKLIPGHMSDVPGWLFRTCPDAYLYSQNGDKATNAISYWCPDLIEKIKGASITMINALKQQNLWNDIYYYEVSLGCAGEPLYPPLWTTPSLSEQQFWCYSDAAKTDFRNRMRSKYSGITQANEIWGTSYTTWDEVTVQQPGVIKGAYWNDVLTWYRDVKREKVTEILDMTHELLKNDSHVRIVLNIPGVQYSQLQWQEALQSDTGGASDIKIMNDNDFLLDYACKNGDMVEYTGLCMDQRNIKEIARIKEYCKSKGADVDVWAENVGDEGTASQIPNLMHLVIDNKLYGFDYTNASYLYGSDRQTLNLTRSVQLKALFKATNELYGIN